MSEAEQLGQDLRGRGWRERVRRVGAFVAALPALGVSGWAADAGRRVLFVPVLMGAGIGLYFALKSEPAVWWVGVAFVAAAVWIISRRRDWPGWVVAVSAIVAAGSVGFALVVARAHVNEVSLVASETRLLTIVGRVARLEPAERGRTRVWLDVDSTRPAMRRVPGRVRISIGKSDASLSSGDWIEVRGTLRPLPAPVAPGSFDFGRKLWFEGIGGVGFSLAPVRKIDAPRPDTVMDAVASAVQDVRRAVSERILAATSERTGPLAAAFLTGERGLISEDDNVAMRDSSLAHLLSISGLHMALAGFGFFIALRMIFALITPLVLNYPVKKWAAAAAIAASFAYLLLSGASVPTQRAFVMIAVALAAILFDRSALNMRSVAVAAVIVLVLTPEAWIDPSFQMSFAAVVALIAAYEWWNARRIADVGPQGVVRRLLGMVAAAAATSLIAGLATAPIAAFHFNRFTDYGVAANVMVMPVVSFVIMPAGVLALVLMPLGLESLPLAVMDAGLDAMLRIAHWVASWPGAAQSVAAWPTVSFVVIAAGGLWLAIWTAPWRWFGLTAVVAGLALIPFAETPDVLIAGDGDNVAVRGADGLLHLMSPRKGRFDVEIWLRRDGDARQISDAARLGRDGFACDPAGCVASVRGRAMVSVAQDAEALAEDCATADVVIDFGRGWRPRCDSPQIILTRGLLKREGAVEMHLQDDGRLTWTSVARERGVRPWTGAISSGGRDRSDGPAP